MTINGARGYGDAARLYLAAGWSSPLPLPRGAKKSVPGGFTGVDGVAPTLQQVEHWRSAHPDGNFALRLGTSVIGVDIDLYKHPDARRRLEQLLGVPLPATWRSTSRDDGSGIYFYRVPPLPDGRRWINPPVPGVEIVQRRHRYAVCWPSLHPEGRPYRWVDDGGEVADRVPEPDDLTFLAGYAPLLEDDGGYESRDAVAVELTDGEPDESVSVVLERGLRACNGDRGSRHDGVRDAVAGLVRLADQGCLGVNVAIAELRGAFVAAVADDRGGRRAAQREFDDLVDGARHLIATTAPPPTWTVPPPVHDDTTVSSTLTDCIAVYRRWLYMPDADQVVAALGTVAANLLPGDPVWMLVVGASGCGKTETVLPLAALPYVHEAATLTEASLLSGTPNKDRARDARGGLLREVGEFGVILTKDFSGVLTMHRDARASVLSALREVYDGSWTRRIGADGGRSLHWAGKAGFVGCVTPSIDRHHGVVGALGERFLLYRIHVADARRQAIRRIRNLGREIEMRAELTAAVAAVLERVDPAVRPPTLDRVGITALVDLARLIAQTRTPVEREGYQHDVVVMPSLEAPGRLVGALAQLYAGCRAVGASHDTAWRVTLGAAWGSVPAMRQSLLTALYDCDKATTADLCTTTGIPRNTAQRVLEDLVLVGLAGRDKTAEHDTAPWQWWLVDDARNRWPRPSPDTSGGESHSNIQPKTSYDDVLGEGTPELAP